MMKFKSYYFLPITILSLFLSFPPALSQILYRATVTRTNGERISQVASSSNINQLADSIYKLMKLQGNPQPNVTVSLGTVNLNTFQNVLRSKGISAKYYEHLRSSSFSKPDNWKPTNIPSIRSKSKFYGVVLRKSGYAETSQIPFKVTQLRNNVPTLMFDRPKVSLRDRTTITFDINTGNSGLNPIQLEELLTTKDSRLSISMPLITTNAPRPPITNNAGCSSIAVQADCMGESNNADYLIKLSRN